MSVESAAGETRIVIERWRNAFRVEDSCLNDYVGLRSLIDRLEKQISDELPAQCGRWLESALPAANEAVVRIRHVDLQFTVDAAADDLAPIMQQWAEDLTGTIARAARSEAVDEGVLRFPDRAAWLCQFVIDLLSGRAKGKWYYEEFDSLYVLPTGRAAAETIAREFAYGVQVLLRILRSGRLDQLLATFTGADALLILESCFPQASAQPSPFNTDLDACDGSADAVLMAHHESDSVLSQWAGRLLSIWKEQPLRTSPANGEDFHDALRWLTIAAFKIPGAERDPILPAVVEGLLALRRVLNAMPSLLDADRLARGVSSGRSNLGEAIVLARKNGSKSPELGLMFLLRISAGDPDWASHAVAALCVDRHRFNTPPMLADEFITPIGGVFLLAPILAELGLYEVSAAAAGKDAGNHPAAALFRLMVFAQCVGSARSEAALSDPVIAWLSGCDRATHPDGDLFTVPNLARAQSLFISRLVELRRIEGRCLVAECFPLSDGRHEVLLIRDVACDEWLHATVLPSNSDDREQALLAAIEAVYATTGNLPHVMLLGPLARLAASLHRQKPVAACIPIEEGERGREAAVQFFASFTPASESSKERVDRTLDSSVDVYRYFSFPGSQSNSDLSLDALTVLMSRAALKSFARRIFGYQSSSPESLYQNFFEGESTVRHKPVRTEVELPPTPLRVVTELSGMARQSFKIPWLGGREVCLLPPPG